ncbi:hypothetical protein HQ50_04785 [Porphyromonas sp. COT-052 OH4946]|uniref:hypothetical protein n=1 Tax=Porphyromonas sp. COT-052 OH4946 TaxID=1515618 RepID=UPI00051DF3B9|nr:hypothetical protein [Porphyromonas sp. COT-052 OH4946]KGL56299.1 hypothetical protein HQ50_04785 [Porphyromonas sp. COT-052 OH4946]
MKLKISFLLLFFTISQQLSAQEMVKVTSHYGIGNEEIQDIIDFENIYVEKLTFQGKPLKGKSYIIDLEEYKEGKRVNTSTLFDGTETDYFRIKSEHESIKFFFKINEGKLKTYIRGAKFASQKFYSTLPYDPDKYAVKDFFGEEKELTVDLDKRNTIFAIITPTIHEDGSGSYCEVVQSGIAPEKLGEHFSIPHYYLVTIRFE